MPDKQHHTPRRELSYYGLSLLSYLKDSHPELIAESEFIAERADSAAQAYSEAIRSGCNHIEAEEIAREELCRGLHFSPYNTLVNILWKEFEAEIPEDTARQAALRLLPLCRGVLEKYDLTDDFADTPDYELFYTELTGTVQILSKMAFNKKTHLRQNIDALKTAFTLDRERRAPTPEERTLGAYSGFGAIKEVLENPTGKPDKDGMATLVAELHEVIRANTPDEREYKRYMDGIKNSVLTAFYTPPKVADAIVEAIWDTRIVPKRILDPSAGTGVFVSAVDFHAPYAEITCFEKDPATGLILKHLHPEKRVRVQGFEASNPNTPVTTTWP